MATATAVLDPPSEQDVEDLAEDVEAQIDRENKALRKHNEVNEQAKRLATGFETWRESLFSNPDSRVSRLIAQRADPMVEILTTMKALAAKLAGIRRGTAPNINVRSVQSVLTDLESKLIQLNRLIPEARPQRADDAAASPPRFQSNGPAWVNAMTDDMSDEEQVDDPTRRIGSGAPMFQSRRQTSSENAPQGHHFYRVETKDGGSMHAGHEFPNGFDFSNAPPSDPITVTYAVAGGNSTMHLGNKYGDNRKVMQNIQQNQSNMYH